MKTFLHKRLLIISNTASAIQQLQKFRRGTEIQAHLTPSSFSIFFRVVQNHCSWNSFVRWFHNEWVWICEQCGTKWEKRQLAARSEMQHHICGWAAETCDLRGRSQRWTFATTCSWFLLPPTLQSLTSRCSCTSKGVLWERRCWLQRECR